MHEKQSSGQTKSRALGGDRAVARRRARPTLAPGADIAHTLKLLSGHLARYGVESGLIHLGGGSVLAAAWEHRRSTDIDLWVPQERAERLKRLARSEEEWKVLMCPKGSIVEPEGMSWMRMNAAMTLNAVPISLFSSHIPQGDDKNRQSMRGTIFGAATTEEIITGKIAGRWADATRATIPIRDIYDVHVARALEPRALERTMRKLSDEERQRAATKLRAVPIDWHERDPKPIIEPKFKVDMRRAGHTLARAIETADVTQITICKRTWKGSRRQREKGWNR